ncbi:tail fiber domain-containing protein [Methylobacterium goesingense]|nr:tail fiber domain-containing protein [Methylobacterium goesingense]
MPANLLGAPALRLTQDLATDGSLLAGGLTMQATGAGLSWTLAGLAGTAGTAGATAGFPGGLAIFVKPADGTRPGTLREVARFGPDGNLGLGSSAPLATRLGVAGIIAHTADNTWSLGTPTLRASVIYAGTGAISTSDAREKTPVAPLSEAEIAAARALAGEIGTFRFREALARKGDEARRHVGLTVQRAVAILADEGLDPFAYGFVCRDSWPAVAPREAVAARDAEIGADGTVIVPAVAAQDAAPGREAGERYGFRMDQLLLFLARGFEARLAALEAAAGP